MGLGKLFGQWPDRCTFDGKTVTVTNDIEKFISAVYENKTPMGLFATIKNWSLVYGELLVGPMGSDRSRLFRIGPKGPCHAICSQCNFVIREELLARLGPDSMMAAFGSKPVNKCPECGNHSIIIVYYPRENKPGRD